MTVYFKGVDFAYGQGLTVAQLKSAGAQFVCRYLSGGSSKDITATELDNYLTNGLGVVFNWETTGQMPSLAQGVADARGAETEINRLAAQVTAYSAQILAAPVIFSADFDPDTPTLVNEILAYMRGVASVLGKARTGLYGGFEAIEAFGEAGIGTFGWQSTAWSGTNLSKYAQLYQYEFNKVLGPTEVDWDEALAKNYGQIGASVTPPPPPPPPSEAHWVNSPLVENGSSGNVVKTVQYLLNNAGATLTVDGQFGAKTATALGSFQTAHGIEATDEVHGYTWPVLAVKVQAGSTAANAVNAVQSALNAVNNAGLTVDGQFGAKTTAAVNAFQTKSKLTANGVVDVADGGTFNALVNAELSVPTPVPTPTPTPTPSGQYTAQSGPSNGGYYDVNLLNLGKFLVANGYSKAAAAGIAGCVAGESLGNPESVGSGGGGLIGWTPLPKGMVTGDATKDLNYQFSQILAYNKNNWASLIPKLNAQTDPVAAADYYSEEFERPAVKDGDVKVAVANSVFAQL